MNIGMNPNSELKQSVVSIPDIVQVPDDLVHQAREFQEAIMMYSCAIREVKTKLEVLNDELSVRNQRNPIEMIKSRVKKPLSIVEKLHRKNLPITLDSMVNYLDDVAGIRVICSFVDDIVEVPVFFSDQKKDMRVEVQIRTIAMDFWASLDHQLKYKKDIGDAAGSIGAELKKCADVIAKTDRHMLVIRKSIEAQRRTVRQ